MPAPSHSGRDQVLALETEARWMAQVIRWAKRGGWAIYHTRDSRGSEPGFPDLILVRGSVMLCVELKRLGGRTSPAQARWLEWLSQVETVWAGVWTPTMEREVRDVLVGSRVT